MLNSLTSLRFFFAFAVFLSHLTFVKTNIHWYNWVKNNIFFEGYVGVGFFFTLSGFVLALNYYQKITNNPNFSKKHFYIARIARIYPLHVLTFCIMLPYVILYGLFAWDKTILNFFLLQSFIPFKDYFASINNVSWSISTELFFYLMFPFYVLWIHKYKWLKYAIFIIAIPLLFFLKPYTADNKDLEKWVYYINPIIRSLDFILGIIIFQFYNYIKNNKINYNIGSFLEIITILIFILFFSFHEDIPRAFRYGIYYWIPISLIVIIFALQKGFISKILQNKTLVYLGEISFGFYMLHMIVIKYGNMFFNTMNDFIKIGVYFFIALLLSVICFEYFEKPMTKLIKNKFLKKKA